MSLPISQSSLKRKYSEVVNKCILCDETCTENKTSFPLTSWNNLKEIALEWKGEMILLYIYDAD